MQNQIFLCTWIPEYNERDATGIDAMCNIKRKSKKSITIDQSISNTSNKRYPTS